MSVIDFLFGTKYQKPFYESAIYYESMSRKFKCGDPECKHEWQPVFAGHEKQCTKCGRQEWHLGVVMDYGKNIE